MKILKDNFSFALKILQNITCTYLISLQNLTFCVNNDNNEYNPIIEYKRMKFILDL